MKSKSKKIWTKNLFSHFVYYDVKRKKERGRKLYPDEWHKNI